MQTTQTLQVVQATKVQSAEKTRYRRWLSRLAAAAALAFSLVSLAAEQGKDGFYVTGSGVRAKTLVFKFDVYAIRHSMKTLPPAKSRRAVIDAVCDKRFQWTMLRDIDADKFKTDLREGYQLNGYTDQAKIERFVGLLGDLPKGASLVIAYDAAKKSTSLQSGLLFVTHRIRYKLLHVFTNLYKMGFWNDIFL